MSKISFCFILTSLAIGLSACSNNTDPVKAETATPATAATSTTATAPTASYTFGVIPPVDKAKASYVVVSQPSYPPFASRDHTGNAVGLDIDILSAIAEKENIHFDFIAHNMEGLLETLNKGDADIVATGVNITPERQQIYDFSKPYMEGNWAVMLDGAKGEKVTDIAQLKEKAIAVQESSLSQKQLTESGITSNIVPVKTVFLGLTSIAQNKVIGVYDVDSVLNTYIKSDNKLYTVIDKNSGTIPFGFVLKKGNTQLKAILDKGIDTIKADGTYDKIYQKWYPNSHPTVTTASVTQ